MKQFGFGFLTGIVAYYALGVYAMHRMNKSNPYIMEDFYDSVYDEFFNGQDMSEAKKTCMNI